MNSQNKIYIVVPEGIGQKVKKAQILVMFYKPKFYSGFFFLTLSDGTCESLVASETFCVEEALKAMKHLPQNGWV